MEMVVEDHWTGGLLADLRGPLLDTQSASFDTFFSFLPRNVLSMTMHHEIAKYSLVAKTK